MLNATEKADVDDYQAAVPLVDSSDEEEEGPNHNMAFSHELADELDEPPDLCWSGSESDDYQTSDDEGGREEDAPNPLKKHRHMGRQEPEEGEEEGKIILQHTTTTTTTSTTWLWSRL